MEENLLTTDTEPDKLAKDPAVKKLLNHLNLAMESWGSYLLVVKTQEDAQAIAQLIKDTTGLEIAEYRTPNLPGDEMNTNFKDWLLQKRTELEKREHQRKVYLINAAGPMDEKQLQSFKEYIVVVFNSYRNFLLGNLTVVFLPDEDSLGDMMLRVSDFAGKSIDVGVVSQVSSS